MRCKGCGTHVRDGEEVLLGRRHGFCGTPCMYSWAADRVIWLEAVLNRIFVRSRGFARKLALDALTGNVKP